MRTGATRKDKIRNEYVRGTAKIAKLGDKLWNARLRWYGHVKRREECYAGKRIMEMAVPSRKKRGRPKRGWMNLAREDMGRVGATEGDEVDRKKWNILSLCGMEQEMEHTFALWNGTRNGIYFRIGRSLKKKKKITCATVIAISNIKDLKKNLPQKYFYLNEIPFGTKYASIKRSVSSAACNRSFKK